MKYFKEMNVAMNTDKRFENLPDDFVSDLNTISSRLYSKHAAVMVGAGFSRNACRDYPDWKQLGDLFYSLLHPGEAKVECRYENIMNLAEEVEACKGRLALDACVQDLIRDGSCPPSQLHVELLSLPWMDVYTTNYDTLLEAALPQLLTRRYSVVVSADQLASAKEPRIIKLHGSFPSTRPFVLTTEDYRQYPQTHAAFVNTVRQALLEKTLCLVGFSGDDPNFLSWEGWTRDCLGQNEQPIYLVTLKTPSSSQVSLLAKRNIRVVPLEKFNIVSDDYTEAFRAFFDYLKWKNRDPEKWMDENYYLAATVSPESIEQTSKRWRRERESFCGKLTVSHWELFLLVNDLQKHDKAFVELTSSRNYQSGLRFCFEFLWRLEKALRPVPDMVLSYMQAAWSYWSERMSKGSVTRQSLAEEGLSYDLLFGVFVRLMRCCRERALDQDWKDLSGCLAKHVSHASAEVCNEYHYQRALFSLAHFEFQGTRTELEAWDPSPSEPFALARCGTVYAMMHEWSAARRCLSDALFAVRKISSYNENLRALHIESVIIGVYRWVIQNDEWRKKGPGHLSGSGGQQEAFSRRLLELRGLSCDILEDVQHYEVLFSRSPEKSYYENTVESFDLEYARRTWGFKRIVEDGYSYLSFVEQVGLPLVLNGEQSINALSSVVRRFPCIALPAVCYSCNSQVVDKVITRENLAALSPDIAASTVERILDCLGSIIKSSSDDSPAFKNEFANLIEVASRLLCCVQSKAVLSIGVKFVCEVVRRMGRIPYGVDMNVFIRRLVRALPDDQFLELVDVLVKVECPKNYMPVVPAFALRNPLGEVFNLLADVERRSGLETALKGWSADIEDWQYWLYELENGKNEYVRTWILTTCILCLRLGKLTELQKDDLRKALLGSAGEPIKPYWGCLGKHLVFLVAAPSVNGLKDWYFSDIFSQDWFCESTSFGQGIAITRRCSSSVEAVRAAVQYAPEWFDDELLKRLLQKLGVEWLKCDESLAKTETVEELQPEGMARSWSLSRLLVWLAPFVAHSGEIKDAWLKLVVSLGNGGAPTCEAKATFMNFEDGAAVHCMDLLGEIEHSLHSTIKPVVNDAAKGLVRLLESKDQGVLDKSIMLARNMFGWMGPADANLALMVVDAIDKQGLQHRDMTLFVYGMFAKWHKLLNLDMENELSFTEKIRAIISVGKMLRKVTSWTGVDDYMNSGVRQMKKDLADRLPFVEVRRAWQGV